MTTGDDMKKLLVILGVLALSAPAAGEVLEVNKDRLVKVLGTINGSIVDKANQVMELAGESSKDIYVFINSPGGSVRAGEVFLSALTIAKSRGVTVKCVSSIYSASMAFSILAACSERYVLENAKLLFHPVRIGLFMTVLTQRDAERLHREMLVIDEALKATLLESMGMDEAVFTKAFYEEKWWSAKELQKATVEGWLTIVEDVRGIDKKLFSYQEDKKKSKRGHERELKQYGNVILNSASITK